MTQNGRNSEIHVKFLSTIVALAGVALILLGTHYRTQIGIAGDVQFVPDLVGMDFDEADIVLRRIGLVAKPVQRTFRNVEGVGVEERLRIIDQSEQPETRVDRLSVLKVAVEETRRVVTIPDVVDHAVKEAIS
ncbi:MAG: PASTA domain-containing protein, partial [Planctomycetota bacterium]|nr:PASTA domain-containing protein [Planctomycetota bacterium]